MSQAAANRHFTQNLGTKNVSFYNFLIPDTILSLEMWVKGKKTHELKLSEGSK